MKHEVSLPVAWCREHVVFEQRQALRLLIPVKHGDDARQAVGYALQQRATGLKISVCLLHVEESVNTAAAEFSWPVAGTQSRSGGRQTHLGRLFDKAMQLFVGLEIEVAAYIRKGPVAFAILDAAEELDCQEIVLPAPPTGFLRWLSRNVVATLLARQRSIRVLAISRDGTVLVS